MLTINYLYQLGILIQSGHFIYANWYKPMIPKEEKWSTPCNLHSFFFLFFGIKRTVNIKRKIKARENKGPHRGPFDDDKVEVLLVPKSRAILLYQVYLHHFVLICNCMWGCWIPTCALVANIGVWIKSRAQTLTCPPSPRYISYIHSFIIIYNQPHQSLNKWYCSSLYLTRV